MAERGRAEERAEAWPAAAAARRRGESFWPHPLADRFSRAAAQIKEWLAVEAGPGRLMPWLPVAFGAGIIIYFTADREPSLVAALALAAAMGASAFGARRRPVAFPVLLGLAAAATGFAIATSRSAYVSHPVLQQPVWNVAISGWVEVSQERERTDRIVIRVHRMEGRRLVEPLERVRLSVRKGKAPPVGSFVELKARLNPPLQPLRPGGYNFARDLYFQGIGASGFVLGPIKLSPPPAPMGLRLQLAAVIEKIRSAIDRRIRSVLAGDPGSIASALITGKRDAISAPVNDAMYVSSLAHVLSISGYHMALVAGTIFFAVRALMALVPGLALRRPIKKWAALVALGFAAFYLLLSGAEVATQRSFVMTAIVLFGVMVDRPALTTRTLAVAAIGVLLLSPEAIVQPSFQMSFAAALALVAAYERGLPWTAAGADTSLGARVALWGGREIVALVLASLVAGLATTPYAAYHFHRLAPYGVIANLLAMPIVSAIVMPAGLVGLVLLPFGFDGPLWQLMGVGIEWMVRIALWVAQLPGAVGHVPAFGIGALLLGTAGLLLLCLLKTPLRWLGAAVASIAVMGAGAAQRPDLLVADGGGAFAARTPGGQLAIVRVGGDTFAVREWLAADGDARKPDDPALSKGFSCDEVGCRAKLRDGSAVAVALRAEAFAEDCARAEIVLSARTAPPFCKAHVIDRTVWTRTGAQELRRTASGFESSAVLSPGRARPWMRVPAGRPGLAPDRAGSSARLDATPRIEDFAPDD